LLSHPHTDPGRDVHLASTFVRLACTLLEALHVELPGGPVPEPPPMPPLVAQPDELEAAARLRSLVGVEPGRMLVVAPGARYGPTKRYPAERFARAAADIAGPRAWRVVLVGEAADAETTRAVAALLPGAVDLAGRTRLPELVGLLAGSNGVLANDSGTMHLAAALGAAVVGVFGSTNPRWTRPLGSRATFVVRPVACAPCYAPECRTDFGCMLSLPASALVDAWGQVGTPAVPPDGRTSPAGARP
jgi:lipopolysaccharide heptosyltransferase II